MYAVKRHHLLERAPDGDSGGKTIVENPLGAHSVAPSKLRHCPLQRRHYECKRSAARVEDVALVLWSESVRL